MTVANFGLNSLFQIIMSVRRTLLMDAHTFVTTSLEATIAPVTMVTTWMQTTALAL